MLLGNRKTNAKTVSFISASGGVGKTTLAILFAKYLIKVKGVPSLKILLVDLDPTAGLSLSLMDEIKYKERVENGWTLVNLYKDYQQGLISRKIDYYVKPVEHEGIELNVLVPGEELEEIIEKLWHPGGGGEFLDLLENSGVYTYYDYVIFDSAPFFDMRYTVLSIYAASKYVVLLRPSLIDARRTSRMISRLIKYAKDLRFSTYDFLAKFLGVINMARSGTIEGDALLRLGFKGVSPSSGYGKAQPDERRTTVEDAIGGLKKILSFPDYVIPLDAEIARLNLSGALNLKKKKEKEEEVEKTPLGKVFKAIWNHVVS
jgi:chromosome partitioning protein